MCCVSCENSLLFECQIQNEALRKWLLSLGVNNSKYVTWLKPFNSR